MTQESPPTRGESAGHTFEEYTSESEKLKAFVDKVEDRLAEGGFDVLRSGFWDELVKAEKELAAQVAKPREWESENPLTGEKEIRSEPFADSVDVANQNILGRDAYLLGIFARDLFHYLNRRGLLTSDDRELFLKAAPSYERPPNLDARAQEQVISSRQEAARKLLHNKDASILNQAMKERLSVYRSLFFAARGEQVSNEEITRSSKEMVEAFDNENMDHLAHGFSPASRRMSQFDLENVTWKT